MKGPIERQLSDERLLGRFQRSQLEQTAVRWDALFVFLETRHIVLGPRGREP